MNTASALRTMVLLSAALALVLGTALLVRWSEGLGPRRPDPAPAPPVSGPAVAIRIGLIPERDIFGQRRRYRVLADYLAAQVHRPVELVTLNTYQAVLKDLEEKQVDAAFLGSLVAVLAMDRLGAKVLLKTELPGRISMYHGVVFTLADSPVKAVSDLAGRPIALLRTTTGGNLFPVVQMQHHGLLEGPRPPELHWMGTHDEVIAAVVEGRAVAGGVKDLVLDDYERAHPQVRFRRIASSEPVPNNALVLRGDVADTLGPLLSEALRGMSGDPQGQAALKVFGAERFVPCETSEYHPIYDLLEQAGPAWSRLSVNGAAPRRPRTATQPAS